MDVHVDESGDDQVSGNVDDVGVDRGFDSCGNTVDAAAPDQKVCGRIKCVGGIDNPPVLKENRGGLAHEGTGRS